jgi:cobalamin biosynthesis protein CobT
MSTIKKKSEDIIQDDNDDNDDDDNDNEDEDEEEEDNDEENDDDDNEEENDDDNEEENKDEKIIIKKKKIKESFNDNILQLNEFIILIKNLDEEIDNIDKEYKLKIKKRNTIFKQFLSKFKNIQKIHDDELIIERKTKPKRKSSNNGFIKPNPVPEILRKFLNLDDDILLPRPTVSRLLNAKFNELGLKKGQNTQLNEEVCNLLKLNYNDYKEVDIKLTSFQTFLATFYKLDHEVKLGN